MEDTFVGVRLAAVETIGKTGDPRALKELSNLLNRETHDTIRAAIAGIVSNIGGLAEIGQLVALLATSVSWAAQEALLRIGAPAIKPLLMALDFGSVRIKDNASNILSVLIVQWNLRMLRASLDDEELADSKEAIKFIVETMGGLHTKRLITQLAHKNKLVRIAAAGYLEKNTYSEAIDPLIRRLNDEDEEVRNAVASALGKFGTPAVPALIRSLKNKPIRVRCATASILGEIKDGRAIGPLREMLGDKRVNEFAAKALRRMSEQVASLNIDEPEGVKLIELLDAGDDASRIGAIQELGLELCYVADNQMTNRLISLLGDDKWHIRIAAALALDTSGHRTEHFKYDISNVLSNRHGILFLGGSVLRCLLDCLIERIMNGTTLSNEENGFLRQIVRTAKLIFTDSAIAFAKYFKLLKDFEGLRLIASRLPKGLYRNDILWLLEDYESMDYNDPNDMCSRSGLNALLAGQIKSKVSRCVNRNGKNPFHDFDGDRILPVTSALSALIPSYDVCISLARGGLFAGTLAELLGAKVFTFQVAAHDLKRPWARFVGEVKSEDIRGKRILLLEDDTATGASLTMAANTLQHFKPAAMAVFFSHAEKHLSPRGLETANELGLKVYHSNNIEKSRPFVQSFHHLHEMLGTTLGRLRTAARELRKGLADTPQISDEDRRAVNDIIYEQERLFFALNHFLPSMEHVRERIVGKLELLLNDLISAKKLLSDPFITRVGGPIDHWIGMAASTPVLPLGFEGDLAHGRYYDKAVEAAKAHGIDLKPRFHSVTAAFHTAKRAMRGKYDIALIVGPEGFLYEPIFKDLGLPTIAVNIPEDDFGGSRTFTAMGDLSALKGKRVLVVEDDVRSGATLKKLLEAIKPYSPKSLGLYLGLPSFYQEQQNIPREFRNVYIADENGEKDGAVFMAHLKNRETIFKQPFKSSRRRSSKIKPRV